MSYPKKIETQYGVTFEVYADRSARITNERNGERTYINDVADLREILDDTPGRLPDDVTWDDAPHGANYAAIDRNGDLFWYKDKPHVTIADEWTSGNSHIGTYVSLPYPGWENSLVKRPGRDSIDDGKIVTDSDGKIYRLVEIE